MSAKTGDKRPISRSSHFNVSDMVDKSIGRLDESRGALTPGED